MLLAVAACIFGHDSDTVLGLVFPIHLPMCSKPARAVNSAVKAVPFFRRFKLIGNKCKLTTTCYWWQTTFHKWIWESFVDPMFSEFWHNQYTRRLPPPSPRLLQVVYTNCIGKPTRHLLGKPCKLLLIHIDSCWNLRHVCRVLYYLLYLANSAYLCRWLQGTWDGRHGCMFVTC